LKNYYNRKNSILPLKESAVLEKKRTNWPETFFSPDELAEFEKIGQKFSPEQMKDYQRRWTELIGEIRENLHLSPESPEAQELARRWQGLLEEGYQGHEVLLERVGQAYRQQVVPREYSPYVSEAWNFIKKALRFSDLKKC